MADKNRGRSVDDDDDNFDDVDDEYSDDAFDDEVDEDEDEDEQVSSSRSRTKTAPAKARTAVRTRSKDSEERTVGILGRLLTFVKEVIAELQKVIWPTRKELVTYTTVVIVFVAVLMAYVAGLDVGFAKIMFLVFGTGNGTPASTNP